MSDNKLRKSSERVRQMAIVVTLFGLACVACEGIATRIRRGAQSDFYGVPIVNARQNIVGRLFRPQAVIVMNRRILLYDVDGKVYALDGVKLDGVTPADLKADELYRVYQKYDQLLLRREVFWW